MNFYTLDGVKAEAARRGKTLCVWTPQPPVVGAGDHKWVIDGGARIRDWRVGRDRFSHRILVRKDGAVEGL